MADKNFALDGTASGSGTNTIGTDTNINDDDTGTYFGAVCGGLVPPGAGCSWEYTDIITLDGTYDINKAEINHTKEALYGGEGEWWVDLYYSSSWHNVLHGTYNSGDTTVTESDSTGWSNVSKIRVRADGSAYNGWGYQHAISSSHRTNELRVWGEPYEDVGLKIYDGSSNIKIGVESLDGHKLRFYNGSTTYGIPLLATDDANASSIRIHDGNAAENLVTQSGDNLSHIITTTNEDSTSNSKSDTYDEDWDTYYGCERTTKVSGSDMKMTSQHAWDTGRTIKLSKATGKFTIIGSGYSPLEYYGYFRLYIKQNGNWNKIKEYIYDESINMNGTRTMEVKRVLEDRNVYSNVTGIKFEVYTKFEHGGQFDNCNFNIKTYEIECQGYTGSGSVKALPKVS